MSTVNEPSPPSLVRSRSEDDITDERAIKRQRLDDAHDVQAPGAPDLAEPLETLPSPLDEDMKSLTPGSSGPYNLENVLPQSRTLMGLPPAPELPPDGFMHRTCEVDVGISQYIGQGLSEINGIIKQRFFHDSRLTALSNHFVLDSRTFWFMKSI